MNSFKLLAGGIVLVGVLGLVFYEARQTRAMQGLLETATADRVKLERHGRELEQRVTQAEERQAFAQERGPAPAPPASSPLPVPEAPRTPETPVPGITTKAPAGWVKNGSKPDAYVVGVDQTQMHDGLPSAYVKSVADASGGFGGMMQTIAATDYTGKRVRYSAWVKTEEANDGGGHLWLRIDGQTQGAMPGFDNMGARPVKGTTDWQEVSVVLDVPPESRALAYGMFVSGNGAMWVSGAKFEEVGPEVPATNMLAQKPAAPSAPQNLNFQ